jgi:hypothetical protein
MDDSLRRVAHKCTTKIERHHLFARHLAFGGGGHLRTNDPADQEKAIVYNELVANAVALQNVVDQTNALHLLRSEGALIRHTDLTFLSPYATSYLRSNRPIQHPEWTALILPASQHQCRPGSNCNPAPGLDHSPI